MYETFDEGNWAGHSVVMPWVRPSSPFNRSSCELMGRMTETGEKVPRGGTGAGDASVLLADVAWGRD